MTLLLRPEFSPAKASMLTLVMALSAAEGIQQACGIQPAIKWPNDLVVNGKKICGILTELYPLCGDRDWDQRESGRISGGDSGDCRISEK